VKTIIAVLAVLGFTACEPAINPPPIPPPVVYVIKEIFWSSHPDPSGVHAPRDPHSCSIIVEPADASGHAYYTVQDDLWVLDGWGFWTACVIAGRDLGRAVPAVKVTGDENSPTMRPVLDFKLDTAPVLGRGSGHYPDPAAQNISIWRRAYVQSYGA
jgi:hypothetical protein